MQIIKPSVRPIDPSELSESHENAMSPAQIVERCGRVCYKSEDYISDEEHAVNFTKRMIEHQHTAMLEHAVIYFRIENDLMTWINIWIDNNTYIHKNDTIRPYIKTSTVTITHDGETTKWNYMSASLRTLSNLFDAYFNSSDANVSIDALYYYLNKTYDSLFPNKNSVITSNATNKDGNAPIIVFTNKYDFINDVTNFLSKEESDTILKRHVTHSLIFTCDRGVSHEFVRHRPCSFAQESTRYCNYSKNKFNNEITVIEPLFFKPNSKEYNVWKTLCEDSEKAYMKMLEMGCTSQQARSILPNSLKTEIVITASESQWQHMINLRLIGTTGAPHPQMVEVMDLAYPLLAELSDNRITK